MTSRDQRRPRNGMDPPTPGAADNVNGPTPLTRDTHMASCTLEGQRMPGTPPTPPRRSEATHNFITR
jgi:hypothetical protein